MESWEPKVYSSPRNQVSFNNVIYENKWYAELTDKPGEANVWKYLQDCTGEPQDNVDIEFININNGDVIEVAEGDSITINALITDPAIISSSPAIVINDQSYNGNQVSWIPTEEGLLVLKAQVLQNDKLIEKIISVTISFISEIEDPTLNFISPNNGETIVVDKG